MRSNSKKINIEAGTDKANKISAIKIINSIGKLIAGGGRMLSRRLQAEWQTTVKHLSLGMKLKQWTAMWLICIMLLSIFLGPASAAVPVNNNSTDASTINSDNSEVEPINPPQPFWKEAETKLKLTVENWLASFEKPVFYNANGEIVESPGKANIDNKDKNEDVSKNKKNAKSVTSESTDTTSEVKESNKISDNTVIVAESDAETEKLSKDVQNESPEATTLKTNSSSKNVVASAPLMVNQLPDAEQSSVYSYENNLGSPIGQVEMDSPNRAATLGIKHRAGIANFSFGIPFASIPGRGIDAGVGMTYNSRTWNKSCTQYDTQGNCSQNHFTYDVEQSWIAPGFSSGFGYLESVAVSTGSYGLYKVLPVGITDTDGTRHEFVCKTWSGPACTAYETTDGAFIKTSGQVLIGNINSYSSTKFNITYPNGTKVYYAGAFGSGNNRKHYPVIIQDSNGNRIRIAYKDNQSGRIDYITDTINRKIKFYYENDANGNPDKLVTVTIPGTADNTEIQTIRFYYENMTLQSGGFVSGSQVTAPSSIRVLRYVYTPSTKTGYKYDYHPKYGMISKITLLAGMQADSTYNTSTSVTGSIITNNSTDTDSGVPVATTEYDYPDGSTPINEVPKYSKRTDDWAGRISPEAAVTEYYAPEPGIGDLTRTSTVTVKDSGYDVRYETISHNTGDWKNGLISENAVNQVSGRFVKLMSKTKYFWEQGNGAFGGRQNPILRKIEVTNDAGQTKTIWYDYDQYNNQKRIDEYDFGKNELSNVLPLRRTNITYETGQNWINANLLGLTKSVETVVSGVTVSKTIYQYDHNGSDSTITPRNDIDISTHDTYYNPAHPEWDEEVCPYTPDPQNPNRDSNGCTTIHHYGYSSGSAYRGNVTQIAGMLDVSASTPTDNNADIKNYNYDIAGNIVSATLSCCQLKTLDYGNTFAVTGYAYPVSQTKGTSPQLTTSAEYNKNTGLLIKSTDENNQYTEYQYESDTLRLNKVIYPNGAYVQADYSDKLATNANEMVPGYIRTTTTLDSSNIVQNYSYFDGRGSEIRNATQTPTGWIISAAEYDVLGRKKKSYNPFSVSSPVAVIPAGTTYTQISNYDALGRATAVQLQDGSTINNYYNEAAVTFTSPGNQTNIGTVSRVKDQADKERRQIADALGRIIRVDEPTTNGLGAATTPNQPTFYEYDGNDNLKKITQTEGTVTQEREFKYDSLSRLTHERQIEATATLDINGDYNLSASTRWTKVLKYSPRGLLQHTYDARGVHAQLSYDGLNRLQNITYSDGTPAVTYTYDQARTNFFNSGALTRIETAAGTGTRADTPATATEFDYDLMGRVKQHRQIIGSQTYNLEYAYNLAGQLVSEKYPSGKTISMNYDTKGRLSGISDQSRSYLGSLQYQGNGGEISAMTLGNGITESFEYNDRLQMKKMTWAKGNNVIQRYDYTFGELNSQSILKNNGKLAQVDSYNAGTTASPTKQFTQKFTYDSVGRLKQETENRGDNNNQVYQQTFDYDRFGNRYLKATANPANLNPLPTAAIEDNNIDRATNHFATNTGTTYDDAGNVTVDGKFRNLKYYYDANGRMYKTSTTSDTNPATSVYDASGQRVATQIYDVWRFMVYDAFGKMIAEYGGIQGTDEGGVKYPHQDIQGSTRILTDINGAVKARTDYQAFGQEIQSNIGQRTAQGYTSSDSLRQKYALTERDDATGLDHAWFRKNETKAGRWTSPDPYNGSMNIANPQSFNRYAYVENQPTNFVDPSGLNSSPNWLHQWWILASAGCVELGGERGNITICNYSSPWNTPDPSSGGDGGGSSGEPASEKCNPGFFDENGSYSVSGWGRDARASGADLNYAARVVFAEAASMFKESRDGSGNISYSYRPDWENEFDAVASVLYNRIGKTGFSGGVQSTFRGVADAPNQFASVDGAKFNSSAPGQYQNLSQIQFKDNPPQDVNLSPGECDNLRAGVNAIRKLIRNGSRYNYTYNLGGTNPTQGWTVIGGSRFQ